MFRTAAAVMLVLSLAACAGSSPPATSAAELTSAARPVRMINGTGRPDAEIAPLVSRALEKKTDPRFVLVPILEPVTQLAGTFSMSVRLEVRSRKDDALLATVRKTVSLPGPTCYRREEHVLLTRAVEAAADDVLAHADALAAQ